MNVYLASRYSRMQEVRRYALELIDLGHCITSRWVWGDREALDDDLMDNPELAQRVAEEDLADLDEADICILFSETPRTPSTRGGRHFEFGWAYGSGMACIVCGPAENVFHLLPDVTHLEMWEDVKKLLKRIEEETGEGV